ncbi:MAG TPA: heparan-alpha-glucosaminide N-acetyltransferase domain-containing protein [Vicinamibacterales bacterium]|jgi:uncharacterized membrane protein|nr:heparan-alpha-glucosaminide N-acetyltransferase domain-containing protein [Vicinamibacterales bacterium]
MAENDSRPRLSYVDWARGIAVLLMIEAHTSDAWTRLSPAVRRTIAFRDATVLGGFAAPLFLWLAGLAVVLAATRAAERSGSRRAAVDMVCRRGLEIFILGFLFRVQGFIITPGSHPVTLFRVDILNIMGPAIAIAGIVWGLAGGPVARVFWYAGIAAAFAMATPIVRASPTIDAWPLWLQWYMRPFGEFTIFTLFPWAGFVFAGGAVGVLIAEARQPRAERRLQAILGVVGAALVGFGFYAAGRPSIYAASSFWTSSPTWFAIRLGILMMALTAIYACEALIAVLKRRAAPGPSPLRGFGRQALPGGPRRAGESGGPLARIGRSSLFIYWIHVELVYGYASWLWRHRLPLWGTAIAFSLFCVLMYRAIGWRDTLVGKWRNRSRNTRHAQQPATA